MGMGLLKNGMPKWLANSIPDAPSIATRFSCAATPEGISLQLRQDGDLDLLCTAGGDRLWKLILNLALGGKMYGLQQFDYFRNVYYAQVPYRVDQGALDVWIRLVPNVDSNRPRPFVPKDSASREEDLTNAVSNHAVVRIEAQPVGGAQKPFLPIAEIRFDAEIQIDQEALHFDPVAGRGFVPHGFLTDLRKTVYPTSAGKRPANQRERRLRDEEGFVKRLLHYLRS